MRPFEYLAAASAAEACDVLAAHGAEARVLAGGTDLLIELRRGAGQAPRLVLDIARVPELSGITESGGDLAVGPLTTHAELMRSEQVRRFAPLLRAAAAAIGAPQIRARGTVGGNLMNAAACADTVPALLALGATVTLRSSRGGERELPLAGLFVKPYQTRAAPEELLVAIRFPKLNPAARSAFIKLGRRNALAIARLSVAAVLEFGRDGTIAGARIVPGAAFPTWQRVTAVEQMLIGQRPSSSVFAAAGRKVSEEMIKVTGRRWSTEYKEPVIAVLVRRALEQCAAGAEPDASPAAGHSGAPGPRLLPPADPRLRSASSQCLIATTINRRPCALTVPANTTLLDLLREHLGLLGTKSGCEIGECGACTVLLDGEPVNACLVLAPQIAGRQVLTVEGLAPDGRLHPLQESFLDHDAVHCGFCTPGMLLSAKALLDWNPRPAESEIRTAISGNLCRCTGYQQIIEAIAKAAAR